MGDNEDTEIQVGRFALEWDDSAAAQELRSFYFSVFLKRSRLPRPKWMDTYTPLTATATL